MQKCLHWMMFYENAPEQTFDLFRGIVLLKIGSPTVFVLRLCLRVLPTVRLGYCVCTLSVAACASHNYIPRSL